MKARRLLPLFLLGACAAPDAAPAASVEVLGDGDPELWIGASIRPARDGDAGVGRERRGDVVAVDAVLPAGRRLRRVVVESEEGVDVVTLIVAGDRVRGAHVCSLQLAYRDRQLALVLQDEMAETETTLAVFAPE